MHESATRIAIQAPHQQCFIQHCVSTTRGPPCWVPCQETSVHLCSRFNADPSNLLAQWAATAALALSGTSATHIVENKGQHTLPLANSYSPTAHLPHVLVARLHGLKFIEMCEMLPEAWMPEVQETPSSRIPSCRAPISDIMVWTECYTLMAAVLAEKFPNKASQLLAYL